MVDQRARANGSRRPEAAGVISRWEWFSAAVGLVIVLATLGTLLWLAATQEEDSVQPVLQATAIEQQGDRFRVHIRAHNAGSAPAAALRVTAQLRSGGQVLEEAEAELQYLPGHSTREASVFFRRDPRGAELILVPRGYEKP